jgi:hypothetical protein
MDEIWIQIYDPETKEQSKEWRQWFPVSKEVRDTEVIRQGVGVCLLGQRWNFACRCDHHNKALLHTLKQQLVTKS